jgi:hypothetical protein
LIGDVNNDDFADILTSSYGVYGFAGQTYLILGEAVAGRLSVKIQQIYVDNLTIKITFIVKNSQGNKIANVQIDVSNQTQIWTGLTNATGNFEVIMEFTPLKFFLEVQASNMPPYSVGTENFTIQIDLTQDENFSEVDSTTESTTSTSATTTIISTTTTTTLEVTKTATTTITTTTQSSPSWTPTIVLISITALLILRKKVKYH